MERLSAASTLAVGQRKEWGEILTGFETKNKYAVTDETGNLLYAAAEVGGSLFLRLILKSARPFTVLVVTTDGQTVIEIKRPFRFYFQEAEIRDGQQQLLGRIKRRFSFLRRVYTVYDSAGEEIFQLFGPILRPWTFQIKDGETELGKITKKWSGLLKEAFTDADNFGITFPADWNVRLKALFLGAVFLIDFVHFESK